MHQLQLQFCKTTRICVRVTINAPQRGHHCTVSVEREPSITGSSFLDTRRSASDMWRQKSHRLNMIIEGIASLCKTAIDCRGWWVGANDGLWEVVVAVTWKRFTFLSSLPSSASIFRRERLRLSHSVGI